MYLTIDLNKHHEKYQDLFHSTSNRSNNNQVEEFEDDRDDSIDDSYSKNEEIPDLDSQLLKTIRLVDRIRAKELLTQGADPNVRTKVCQYFVAIEI